MMHKGAVKKVQRIRPTAMCREIEIDSALVSTDHVPAPSFPARSSAIRMNFHSLVFEYPTRYH